MSVEPRDVPDGIAPELPAEAMPKLDDVQKSWTKALDELLARWFDLTAAQNAEILDAIAMHVQAGDVVSLLSVAASTQEAAQVLETAMLDLGNTAAAQVVDEAERQGVEPGAVHPIGPERLNTAATAQVLAAMAGRFLVGAALGEVMRIWAKGRAPADVRDQVSLHLESLTDAYPRLVLGGALTKAQRDGRLRTVMGGPEAALYANEILDVNTCDRCRAVNRKWIGNASDPMPPLTYPVAGYIHCRGRWRCRGMVSPVWRGGHDWTKWIELPPQRHEP